MNNTTDILPKQPIVKLIVDGLFILCINEETRTAELGVYEYANEHNLFIRISQKDHNSNSPLLKDGILIRKLDDNHEIKEGDISISVSGRPADVLCYQHESVTDDMLTTSPKVNANAELEFREMGYDKDFRWIIDLEGTRFHDKKLDVVPGVIKRKITLFHGTLYTEKWVSRVIAPAYEKAYEKAQEIPAKSDPTRYLFVANRAAFAIEDLIEGETKEDSEILNINYVENGQAKTLSLPKPDQGQGVYYEILISNNCPDSAKRKKEVQSDFQCYYNVVNMPVPKRLELKIFSGAGGEKAPCDLVLLGETPELP